MLHELALQAQETLQLLICLFFGFLVVFLALFELECARHVQVFVCLDELLVSDHDSSHLLVPLRHQRGFLLGTSAQGTLRFVHGAQGKLIVVHFAAALRLDHEDHCIRPIVVLIAVLVWLRARQLELVLVLFRFFLFLGDSFLEQGRCGLAEVDRLLELEDLEVELGHVAIEEDKSFIAFTELRKLLKGATEKVARLFRLHDILAE